MAIFVPAAQKPIVVIHAEGSIREKIAGPAILRLNKEGHVRAFSAYDFLGRISAPPTPVGKIRKLLSESTKKVGYIMHLGGEKLSEEVFIDVFDIMNGKDVPLRICTNENMSDGMKPDTLMVMKPLMEAIAGMGFKLSEQASPKIIQAQCGLTSLKGEVSLALSELGLPSDKIWLMDSNLDKAIREYKDSDGGKPLHRFAVAAVELMRKNGAITLEQAIVLEEKVTAAADRCEEHALLFVEKGAGLVHAHYVELPISSTMIGYHDNFTNAIIECVHQMHGFYSVPGFSKLL